MKNYLPPAAAAWTGRVTDPQLGPQYWYQRIGLLDASQPARQWPAATHALVGYACDEGVRRNQGRVGAVDGPAAARSTFGGMAAHAGPEVLLADAGTVTCPTGDLAATQDTYARLVTRLVRAGIFPIGIGGGHDIAWGTYRGLRAALPAGRIGIINFDAHLDLRPDTEGPNSGTPFHQILRAETEPPEYLAVGIQQTANTPSLFALAGQFGASWLDREVCTPRPEDLAYVRERILHFAARQDHLYLTVDLDGFSSAFAPGVSAASPLGYPPDFFFPVLHSLIGTGKLLGADIAELNPAHDRDRATARLLGQVVTALTQKAPPTRVRGA